MRSYRRFSCTSIWCHAFLFWLRKRRSLWWAATNQAMMIAARMRGMYAIVGPPTRGMGRFTLRIAIFRIVYPMYYGFQTNKDLATIPGGDGLSAHRTEKTRNAQPAAGRRNPASSGGGPGR